MLIGQYPAKAESNGRVILPKRVRRQFKTDKLIITRGYDGCLLLVEPDQFEAVISQTVNQSFLNPDQRNTERFLLGSAFEVKLDDNGRLIIPETLRRWSGIKTEVVFVGLGNRVEIWSLDNWQKQQDYLTKQAPEIAQRLLDSAGSLKK